MLFHGQLDHFHKDHSSSVHEHISLKLFGIPTISTGIFLSKTLYDLLFQVLIEDSLRVKAIMDFANSLTLLEHPVLLWEGDKGTFVASGISTPVIPDGEHIPPYRVQFENADEWNEVILIFLNSSF